MFFKLVNIKFFFKSLYKIGSYIIFDKKPQIIFYYPHHFNRNSSGTNEYFEPFLEICKINKISFLLLEEPSLGSDWPRNKEAYPSDTLFYYVLFFRKVLTSLGFSFWKSEKIMANVFNVVTFNKFVVNNYITISGNMQEFFQCINKSGKVFDFQHGIIYSKHIGYFECDGKLRNLLTNENLHFLLYGEGFKNCFNINKNNNEILHRVHVVGCMLNENKRLQKIKSPNTILISMQFLKETNIDEVISMKALIKNAIKEIDLNKYSVLLKHHPRFNNEVNLDDLFNEFPSIQLTNLNKNELCSSLFLHLTFMSTTTFEYAQFGIPTYFLQSNDFNKAKPIFFDEYFYPLYEGISLNSVVKRLETSDSYFKDSQIVQNWYSKFYSPIDVEFFLNLI